MHPAPAAREWESAWTARARRSPPVCARTHSQCGGCSRRRGSAAQYRGRQDVVHLTRRQQAVRALRRGDGQRRQRQREPQRRPAQRCHRSPTLSLVVGVCSEIATHGGCNFGARRPRAEKIGRTERTKERRGKRAAATHPLASLARACRVRWIRAHGSAPLVGCVRACARVCRVTPAHMRRHASFGGRC